MRIFTNFDTNRVWLFEDNFVFDSIWIHVPSKNLHIALISLWFKMALTQRITWVYKKNFISRSPISIFDWCYTFDTSPVGSLLSLLIP